MTASAPVGSRLRTRVLVLGGTSEIAAAIVKELAASGPCSVVLAGRHEAALERAAAALRDSDDVQAQILVGLEALDVASHEAVVTRAFALMGGVDIVVVAVGQLGARGGLSDDIAAALDVLKVNTVGAGSLVMHCAKALRESGSGTIVVISSMAAERPRRANAVYSASKAGLDGLCQGLADDLRPAGVRIMVVRPGFVFTRMTSGLEAAPLACSAEAVAKVTVRGLARGSQTVWAPSALRWVALAMRLIPRPVFRSLSL